MRKTLFVGVLLLAVVSCGSPDTPDPDPVLPEVPSFAKGADISWASEMEAGGRTFKTKNGAAAALPDVLRDCGFNAVRLRVWVNPYKGWSGREDVVAMAKRVRAAGLHLMVDFHYSDFFADPSRQLVPQAWKADEGDLAKMALHVESHTTEVLSALRSAGVEVAWIQIGNETRGGMLYPSGDLDYDRKGAEFAGFVTLYNAGYAAAKAVYPNAFVMPHLNNAYAAQDNTWWLDNFKAQGGKMDMIALSHYPQSGEKLDGVTLTPAQMNQYALSYIRTAIATYGVPVMVSEVGVKTKANEATAKSVLQSFVDGARGISKCAGVFYWEPEVDGVWKPEIYGLPAELTRYTGTVQTAWGPYDQGAFTSSGQPTAVLDVFAR